MLAVGVVALGGGAATLYLQREAIGVRLALDYLRAHGVPAVLHLDRLDLGGASGSVRLGPAGRPDLSVGRVEAQFGALPAPWRGVRAPPLRALHLVRPVLRARWVDGRLDFGTLQPLIDQALTARPSGAAAPDLYIQDGRLELQTPAGPVTIALDAAIQGGRVRSLHARLEPCDLTLAGVRLAELQGVVSGQATGLGGLHLSGAFGAAGSRASRGAAAGLTLGVEALAPNGAAPVTAGAGAAAGRPLVALFKLHAKRFAPLGTIVADEDRLQQILWNLLLNAVKFTAPEGTVSLAARRTAAGIELVVTDTGEGIDPDFLPYVFDRFRQADGSTTRIHGGLGLGLSIVRHLAELHGGTVRAESDGLGRGASFTVTLPAEAASMNDDPREVPISTPSASRRVEEKRPLDGRSVLVLDDDPDMRELLAMILEDAGAVVRACSSVAAAMESLDGQIADVAISDLAMPGEDGFAFVRRVRCEARELVRAIPLVAMTAYARAEDKRRVLEAGFDRHVAKPIEPEELVAALVAVMNGRPE